MQFAAKLRGWAQVAVTVVLVSLVAAQQQFQFVECE
jgi:hypothetical protein